MSIVWYRVMCDRKHSLSPVCDIEHDEASEASHLYDDLIAGKVPLLDSFGQPASERAAPPPRRSSREITIYPQTGGWAPAGTVDIPDLNTQVQAKARAIREGKRLPKFPSEFVRTARVEVGEVENTDGHTFSFGCTVCNLSVLAVSAGTLGLVLAKIGDTLSTINDVELREQDESRSWVTRRITMRLLPLVRLRSELGDNPRGR